MMKKLVALLMALALLCTSIGAFAVDEEPAAEPEVVAEETTVEEEVEEEPVLAASSEPDPVENETYKQGDYTTLVDLKADGEIGPQCKDHQYAWEDTKHTQKRSCSQKGIRYFICAVCGTPFQYVEDELPHTDTVPASVGYKEGKAPTCTEGGWLTHYKCLYCGDVEWDTPVDKIGHSNVTETVEEPTCTKNKYVVTKCTVCGETSEPMEIKETALGHIWQREEDEGYTPAYSYSFTTATCSKDGTKGKVEVCPYCGETQAVEEAGVVPMLEHQKYLEEVQLGNIIESEGLPKIELDENNVGTVRAVYSEEYIEKDGQKIYAWMYSALKVEYTPATCLEDGQVVIRCTDPNCDAEYKKTIKARGYHDYETTLLSGDKETKDCTKATSTLYKCECGDSFISYSDTYKSHKTNYDKNGNILNDKVRYMQKKATDAKEVEYAEKDIADCIPYTVYYICGNPGCEEVLHETVYPAEKPVHAAENGYIVNVAKTCTTDLLQIYNCSKCGFTQRVEQKSEGHKYTVAGKVIKSSTCKEQGEQEMICEVCNTAKQTVKLPLVDHVFVVNTTKSTKADCTKNIKGVTWYICPMCGAEDHEEFEGHAPEGEIRIQQPTCTVDGKSQYTCKYCHNQIEEPIPATGHSFEYEANDFGNEKIGVDEFMKRHASVCNFDKGVATSDDCECVIATCKEGVASGTKHLVKCTACDAKLPWTGDDQPAHSMFKNGKLTDNFAVHTDYLPTCSKDGMAIFTCTNCNGYATATLKAIGHNYQATLNPDTGIYEMRCADVTNDETGKSIVKQLMIAAGYKSDVADKVIDQLFNTEAGAKILGFGCGDLQPLDVKKAEYKIDVVEEGVTGKLTPVEGAAALDEVYVNITWGYEMTNSDLVSFTACNYAKPDKDGTGYTFSLYGLDVPSSYKLVYVYCEVVSDSDANRKLPGQYEVYGERDIL